MRNFMQSPRIILDPFYRPFIYNNNINDYGFADTIGSLFSVIVFCTIVWGLKEYSNKEKNKQIVLATITYAFLWELMGYFHIYGTFDKKDIIAGILSGIITFFVKIIMERKSNAATYV